MSPNASRGAVAALALLVAVALSVGGAALPAAGAAGAGVPAAGAVDDGALDDATLDGEVLDDGVDAAEDLVDGGSDGEGTSDDGTATVETDADVAVGADAAVDDGGEDDGTPSGSVTAETGAGASVGADVDADVATGGEGAIGVDARLSTDAALAPNASLAASVGTDDGERGDDGETGSGDDSGDASDDGDDADEHGGSGGLPVPDDPESGLAVGSLLVGAGLLGRNVATGALASGGGGGSALSALLGVLRAWGWRLAVLAGYQRWDDSDPLEHETRAAVVEHLETSPGECLTELSDAVDVPLSTLRYHLRILEFEELVTAVEVRGKRRFVPAGVEPDALGPALADEATAAVLEALAREPDSVSGLADRLDRDPSTVTHHLQRLDDEGLVERERDGRRVVNRLADDVGDEVAIAAGARAVGSAD